MPPFWLLFLVELYTLVALTLLLLSPSPFDSVGALMLVTVTATTLLSILVPRDPASA